MAFPTSTVRVILSILMTMKQKMPKLCMGRRVCHTGLVLSFEVHVEISVKTKMRSKMKSATSVAMIYLDARVPVAG